MKAYLIKKDLHNIDFAVKIWYNINVYWHETMTLVQIVLDVV